MHVPERRVFSSGLPRVTPASSTGAPAASWPAALPHHRRILIHAGLHKTGTSALQQFLSLAGDQLREQNVIYPSAGRPKEVPVGHHNLAWQLAGDRRFRAAAGTLDDVAAEISAFPGDAILSSEDFEGVLASPGRLTPLLNHRLLLNNTFTILFYVREQASYLESLFFEMLKHGMAMEASRFCETVLEYGRIWYEDWTFCFDYEALQMSTASLPAKTAIRPYVQLDGGGVIADFLGFTRLEVEIPKTNTNQPANVRVSLPDALALFLQHRIGREIELPGTLAGFLNGRSSYLSPEIRAALTCRFADANHNLALVCGFNPEALFIPPVMPSDTVPLKNLFSLETQTIYIDRGAEELTAAWKRSLEAVYHGK